MKNKVLAVVLLLSSIAGWYASDDPVRPEPLAGNTRTVEAVPVAPGAFQMLVPATPETIARAYLVYELDGLPHWTAVVRSINGLPLSGSFGAVPSAETTGQVEEINPRWLHAGINQVVFFPAKDDIPYTVRNLRVIYLLGEPEPPPSLVVTHPVQKTTAAGDTLLRGFVDPAGLPTGPAELFVDRAYIPRGINQIDGSFSVFVGEAWDVEIEVVYPDGSRIRRTVHLADEPSAEDSDEAEIEAGPEGDASLGLEEARLDVGPGAVLGKVRLTMRGLRHDELPAMDAGMTNVTPRKRGFRLGPHGFRFRKAVELRLPYDPALLPKGMSEDDVRTFYFDEEAGRWMPIQRLEVQSGKAIVSATDHFTDFVNATLALPEESAGANHTPNSLTELAKADPAAEIIQIAPPEGGADGNAVLDYPLVVPPGRQGMQPELAVRYDSSAGNGWLGAGWDLHLSNIEISTLFGVPRYDGSEQFRLDGEQLASTSSSGVYVRRAEGSFDRIVRHGNSPADSWWEVTDKNGVRSQYGRTAQARLRDPHSNNTFRWYLERQIDLHGNTVDYTYFTDQGQDGEPWTEVYPARIDYTGTEGAGAFYHVAFTLDGGDRPDRLSSGLQGFKTYTRHRLATVDVLAGDDVVRRYVFSYRIGDFQKSLLASIAVRGEGGAAEFYRHTFDYVAMATTQNGYDAFAAPQSWGGMARANDLTGTLREGGGAHSFIGVGPVGCQPHGGVTLGGSDTETWQQVTFLDVNGDGLPDRVSESGNVDLNAYDPAADPDGSRAGSFGDADFGKGTLEHTSEWTLDFALGAHAEVGPPVSLDKSWVWSYANDDHVIADVNGDYRPDLVSVDGDFKVRLNDGQSFGDGSDDWSGFDGQGLKLSPPGAESDVLSSFPLSHALRQLVLPYAGRVVISGAVRKQHDGGDGVDAAIYHNGAVIWSRRFDATDVACVPGPANSCLDGLVRDVKAGDSLYFLAGAVRDTSADALLWDPLVFYSSANGLAQEPNGARTFVFRAGEDFALAGYDGASWIASADGTVRIAGSLVKQETSDDVVVMVARQRAGIEQLLFAYGFAASEQTTFDAFPAFDVKAGDSLFLRLSSATPIDPRRVQWTPAIAYQGTTTPDGLPDEVRTQRAQVGFAVPRLVPSHEPAQSWTATATSQQAFGVSCESKDFIPSTFYVQAVNRLIARQTLAAAGKFDFNLPVTAGDTLFFTQLANGANPGKCKVNDGKVPLNVRWRTGDTPSVLSGGHHGWYYGEWNGDVPFQAGGLTPPKSQNDTPSFVPATPRWEGTKDVAGPVWVAGGFDLYLSAEGVKPSRRGANAAAALDEASGTTADGSGLSVLRKSSTKTEGVAVSVAALGLSVSSGESETQLDLLDMNGDRYPDQVSGSGVRFSNGSNGFGPLLSFPGLGSAVRRSDDENVSLSAGLGIKYAKKNGQGKPSAVMSTLPSFGATLSFTQARYDLHDVNGDGLPDRVSMASGAATVQLNLGYRFGAVEKWSLPDLSESKRCKNTVEVLNEAIAKNSSLDTLNALSFTRSSTEHAGVAIGPFGGGASTTLARTLVELADVNGDGLPDRVAKDDGDAFFRVQLNLGDRWDREQRWYAEGWSTPLDDAGGLFQCLDAVTSSRHIEVMGSAGVPLCIPLVPPIVVAGLQIELSGQAFRSIGSGMQLFLEDLDGDGFADHVLKKAGDSNVHVKRNQAGKVNLLSTVHRPLGSTVRIAYERRGNHPDMPFNQWVLSAVSVDDGRGTAPYVTKYDYANDAFYDRAEREGYGFAHVRATLPDGSTIDREFLNDSLYTRFLMTREVLADAKGSLFRADTATYDLQPVAGASKARFPSLAAETTSFYEGTTTSEANAPKTTGRTYEYDTLGNVIRTVDSGDSGSEDDVLASIAYRFDPDTRLTRPATIEVRDGASRLLRKRQGTYNAAGDVTRLEQTLIGGRDPEGGFTYSGSKNAVRTWTYDEAGNIASSTDPSGFTTSFTYDTATRSHPIEVRDSFGYLTRYAYDPQYGEVTETTDQNGNTLRRSYDAFGRIIRVVGPYDSDAAPTLKFEYGLGAPVSWAVVRHKDATRSDTIDSAIFIDSLGRVLQTKEDAELDLGSGNSTRTGMRVSGRIAFDAKGRVASAGQPVFDESPANELVDVPAKKPTTLTYDALDRVRTVRFPHNATTRVDYAFGSLDGTKRFLTTRTDPAGRVTRFYRDVADNVLGVEQTNTFTGARKTLVTRYTYDALDQLVAVADAKGNTTKLEYDTLGRNIVLDNPDLGRTELRYDPAGNLGAKITANLAARAQQIRYHSTFGRLDRIDYPQSPDVVYTWGGPNASLNRAGRIVTVTDASGVEERSYGKLGEIVQTVKTTTALNGSSPNGPYTTRFQFDSFSRLLSVVYPDGETLTYGYDAGGQVTSAAGVMKGARFDYLRHLGYDEFGEHARMVLGNGVETRYTYDPSSRFLSQLRTTAAGRELQNLRYQYDLSGTMQALQGDAVTQAFQYDDLAQLTAAQGTYRSAPNKVSTYTLAQRYDELGNIVAKNQVHEKKTTYNQAYTYGGPQPHAPVRIGERTFRYDANGNQLGWETSANGTRRTLAWNEENRLASVADNGQTTRFLYDADGTRTNKAGQNGETTYVNRWFTMRNGAIASKHVFADSVRLATKVSPDPEPPSERVYFFQSDHLGSTQFVTDQTGAVFQHLEYFPSGEIWVDERSETQRTPYLFSGKELDEETGLSYFGYRYYDPRQGQWISADPILDEMLEQPRSADLSPAPFHLSGGMTAYVGNDPMNLVDPNGLVKKTVLLSNLPPTKTALKSAVKKAKWAAKITRLVKTYGDKLVKYQDRPTGRRELDLESYAYEENGVEAIIDISSLPTPTTRAVHFGYADREFTRLAGLKTKFDRSATMQGSWKTADEGTWHHHPWSDTMSFAPRGLHMDLGHDGGFEGRYGP